MARGKGPDRYLTRMAYARTSGWWVRFFAGRQCLASKLFSDIKCGGSRKALALARQWRDENESRFVAVRPGRPAFHRNDRRNNTKNVGVTLGILPLRTGSARYEWRAKWSADGKKRSRSFSVNKYGYEAAYRLAVEHRCEMLGTVPERKRPPPLRVVLETRCRRTSRRKT